MMTKLGKAQEFLEAFLVEPRPAREVAERAAEAGHAPATLRKAAVALSVVKVREGELGPDQRWIWSLPTEEQLAAEEEVISVTSEDPVGADPLEVLSELVLETDETWGRAATELQWSDAMSVLAREPEVRRFWHGRPRGYSKTSDAAGYLIAAALSGLIPPGKRGFCVAGDRDQAALVSQAVHGFVRRTPELHGAVLVEKTEIKFVATDVVVEVLSSDAATSWGRRGYFWIVDELPSWSDTPNSHEFFDSVTSSWAKVPECRAIIIGTAGSPAHFARKHYETAASSSSWRLSDVHECAPWMLESDIADQQQSLSEGTFARLFRNVWTQAEDHLVSEENLRRCVTVKDWPASPKPNTRYVLGIDLATRYDSSAIAVCHSEKRDGERHVVLDDMEVHVPRPGADVSLPNVEKRVEQLAKRYHPSKVHFDPSNASHMIENLRGRGVQCEEFKFSAASNDRMTNTLHTMLRDGLIDLPDDEALLDELLSVRVIETRLGGLKVDTRPGKHDDRVDSLGIATVVLMERSAATAKFGSSASMPPGRMPRGGGDPYAEEYNPLWGNEWERRQGRWER